MWLYLIKCHTLLVKFVISRVIVYIIGEQRGFSRNVPQNSVPINKCAYYEPFNITRLLERN